MLKIAKITRTQWKKGKVHFFVSNHQTASVTEDCLTSLHLFLQPLLMCKHQTNQHLQQESSQWGKVCCYCISKAQVLYWHISFSVVLKVSLWEHFFHLFVITMVRSRHSHNHRVPETKGEGKKQLQLASTEVIRWMY